MTKDGAIGIIKKVPLQHGTLTSLKDPWVLGLDNWTAEWNSLKVEDTDGMGQPKTVAKKKFPQETDSA